MQPILDPFDHGYLLGLVSGVFTYWCCLQVVAFFYKKDAAREDRPCS